MINEKKQRQTRSAFEKAFMNLYAEKYYSKITVDDICRQAGFRRGTFYNYYENIDDLLKGIEEEILISLRKYSAIFHDTKIETIKNGDEAVLAVYKDLMKYIYKNKQFMLILLSPNSNQYFIFKYKKIILADYEKSLLKNGITITPRVKILLNQLTAGVVQSQYIWLKDNELTVDEIATLLCEINRQIFALI